MGNISTFGNVFLEAGHALIRTGNRFLVINETTHQHLRSNCNYVIEYSQILTGFVWARYPLCLLIWCVVFRNFNELIMFSTEIIVRPLCFVHPATNNLNRLKQSYVI